MKIYFACYDYATGRGNTLEEAFKDLQNNEGDTTVELTEFFEAEPIQIKIEIKPIISRKDSK